MSVPNARHVSLRAWTSSSAARSATPSGAIGTDTHLRWFTRRDIVAAIERTPAGPSSDVSHPALQRSRGLDRLTRGRSTEFLVGQWYVLATKPGA